MHSRKDSPGSFQYQSLEELCSKLGAKKVIRRVLIANNGLAAVKGIDSIKSWLYQHIGDADAIHHVAMASPEDLSANAEFIAMSDQVVTVPGGPNCNNYANVDLIMRSAAQHSCDAIYPGWGHASENPALPRECDRSKHIIFLGPTEEAMFALGDKIASTIVAQSNGVPTVPWSGDSVILPAGAVDVDPSDYEKTYLTTAEECIKACDRIGYPVMIKASEGGGGKGIRCCSELSQVKDMFFAVSEEVKGCHIFAMRMLDNVRHLEVQLLADNYGNCIAVRTRDCSVQRRHQKIIEEGPAFGVDPSIIEDMEQAAIRLAKAVGYRGLGTVEYMYDKTTCKFHFLELNPRIQVEHPVSEMISGINLPAALLCVGMGIRLDRIPEVREFYGEQPYGTTIIDFVNRKAIPSKSHVIAVRITAEDTDESFRPSSGRVDEILFKNSQECWGYFSISSGGAIHQFADSQFGHIFSSGVTREDARRGMIRALRHLTVRGEIRTSTSYVLGLLETPEFYDGDVSTAWLDKIIAQRSSIVVDKDGVYNALVAACIFRNNRNHIQMKERYGTYLAAGHLPSVELLENYGSEDYVHSTDKYTVSCGLVSENEFALAMNGSLLTVPFRVLKSGALQLSIAEKTMVAYVVEEPSSLRITIGGKTTNFTGGLDPTKVMAAVPGRLVRYIIENGAHIGEGGAFAEVEVMKMILPIRVSIAGKLFHRSAAGSTISVGVLLAEIVPDDMSKVYKPTEIKDPWPANFLEKRFERPDGVTRVRSAFQTLHNLIAGYHFKDMSMDARLQTAFHDLASLSLSSVTLESLNLPIVIPPSPQFVNSPSEKRKAIFAALLKQYSSIESAFHCHSREEAITLLKDVSSSDEIYAVDFAHQQACHHDAVISILRQLEKSHAVLKLLETDVSSVAYLRSHAPGAVVLNAKYLLRQCMFPSIVERKAQFARELENGVMEDLAVGPYGYDLVCFIMFDRQYTHLIEVCIEMCIRCECSGEGEVSSIDISKVDNCWFALYSYEALALDADMTTSDFVEDEGSVKTGIANGVCVIFMDDNRLTTSFASVFQTIVQCSTDLTDVTILVSVPRDSTQNATAVFLAQHLNNNKDLLMEISAHNTIYFTVYGMPDGPHMFTFVYNGKEFEENTLLRNVRRQLVRRLELDRLSNYEVKMLPTAFKDVHVFKGCPKKPKPSPLEHRIFARVVVSATDMTMKPWTEASEVDVGHMLSKCTSALEIARDDLGAAYPMSNHIFVKMVEITFDLSKLNELLQATAATYAERLINLGITEVELSFQAKVKSGFIQMRVMVDSPSLYSANMRIFYETVMGDEVFLYSAEFSEDVSLDDNDEALVLDCHSPLLPHSHISHKRSQSKLEALRDMLPSKSQQEPSPFSPMRNCGSKRIAFRPYEFLSDTSLRRIQAHAAQTTYVHDWPHIFGIVIELEWANLCMSRGLPRSTMPSTCCSETRLYCSKADVTKVTTDREEGCAPCGLVAWCIKYFPAAYWNAENASVTSRSFVLVANDITHLFGSIAVPEDDLFKAASIFARDNRLPFIYVGANSGARIGLCNEVKERFRASFNAKGELDYLYLTEADHDMLCKKKISVEVEKRVLESGEVHCVVLGISGPSTEYFGVENLKGAGVVAGEMSKNYSEIPTLSLVSGRSIGIGAYLNRLGRRIVQTGDSPIILTGFNALNRLLGKNVYNNNGQLGGKKIMVPNGVTHFSTKHDFGSVKVAAQWLNYVPKYCRLDRCNPHILTLRSPDPVDRDVTFMPQVDTPYNPRFLVRGSGDTTGLFDKGSWMECLEGWAKTVVTGRATLGGIPCGVILVETDMTKKYNPADPADPTSVSSFTVQAGQVWYPDSARKTADAIEDFHHERLPCFIIANWRGFSGGMKDMYDEVVKFGASIVDNLRVYTAPVFIYIPPRGELRGGAWAVLDPVINHNGMVEMYCDTTSRGGILEASGIAEIKFKTSDVKALIRRCHPELKDMNPKEAEEVEKKLFPRYRDAGIRLADLHDTHFRMKEKGCIQSVVPWKDSRRMFHAKLTRKLKETQLVERMRDAGVVASYVEGFAKLEERFMVEHHHVPAASVTEQQRLDWLTTLESETCEAAEKAESIASVLTEISSINAENSSEALQEAMAKLFKGHPAYAAAAEAALNALKGASV